MSRGASGAAAAYPPSLVLLTLTNPFQLANICALAVPNIWTGSVQQSYSSADPQRHATFFSFCQRVIKTTQISSACVLLALYYIFQLRAAYPNIQANMGSEVRLFTTALILANKFLDDNTFTNKTWSDVSNIPVKELNIMEREFLTALNHNIAVNDQCYFAWVAQLQNWLPLARIMRPVLTPARLGIKLFPSSTSLPPLATSPSMPHNLNRNNNNNNPITTTTTATASSINASAAIHAVKRVSHDEASPSPLQRSFKRRYTPPSNSEFIAYHQKHFPHQRPVIVPVNNSCSRTPLYNTPPIQPDYSCRPVLSWSSSSSALASSRHVTAPTTAVYSAASSVATAAAAAAAAAASINSGYPTSLLTHRVQCLRIE